MHVRFVEAILKSISASRPCQTITIRYATFCASDAGLFFNLLGRLQMRLIDITGMNIVAGDTARSRIQRRIGGFKPGDQSIWLRLRVDT